MPKKKEQKQNSIPQNLTHDKSTIAAPHRQKTSNTKNTLIINHLHPTLSATTGKKPAIPATYTYPIIH